MGRCRLLESLLGFDEFEYLALFLWLAIAGAGPISIDHWLERWYKRESGNARRDARADVRDLAARPDFRDCKNYRRIGTVDRSRPADDGE